MAKLKRVSLFLTRRDEAQQAWAATVHEASHACGFQIREYWSEDPPEQNHSIAVSIFGDEADALLVLPASASGPATLLSHAASRGKAVVLLDRVTHDLDPDVSWSLPRLRHAHPNVLAVHIAPDEEEIGRIQGRQVLALLPKGGAVLCVQGDTLTSAVGGRTAGLAETLAGRTGYSLGRVDGGWSSARAEAAVEEWLRVVLLDPGYRLNLVVSQSEVMLDGIRRAMERLAQELNRPELMSVPLTGCDGMPTSKRAVDEGRLAATVEIPSRAEAAMRALADYYAEGTQPAGFEILLVPSSYPGLEELASRTQS